jgi:peptide deformylase
MVNRILRTSIFLIIWSIVFLLGGLSVTAAPMPIVQIGDPVLREVSRPLSMDEIHSDFIQSLIQTMHDTVHGTGVGLAAPQIGYPLQIAVIEDLQEYIDRLPPEVRTERGREVIPFHVLINPEIISLSSDRAYFFEGCLSVANEARVVPRSTNIQVKYLDENGQTHIVTAQGWYARILQHEIGHLQGTLYIDVSDPRTGVSMEEYKEKWLYARAAEVKQFYDERVK